MKLAKSIATYSSFTFLSKISGLIRDVFLANYFGTSAIVNIFIMALKFPLTMANIISSQSFNSAFVPLFVKYQNSTVDNLEYSFARKIFGLVLLVSILVVVIFEFFAPSIVKIFATEITNQEEFTIFLNISRIVFPYLILLMICSVLTGILEANNKFAASAGLPIIANLTLIMLMTFMAAKSLLSIEILAWGVILGGLTQCVLLFYYVDNSIIKNIFTINKNKFSLNDFYQRIWPNYFSSGIIQFHSIIILYFASLDSALAYIYYADRVYILPYTLIAISISSVLIPNLSRELKSKYNNGLKTQVLAFKYAIVFGLPLGGVLFFLSNDVIEILFQRGEFDSESTLNTSAALRLFILGLPFAIMGEVLKSYFYAKGQPKIPLLATLLATVVSLGVIKFFHPYFGYTIIPFGVSLMSLIRLLFLLYAHKRNNFFKIDLTITIYSLKYLLITLFLISLLLIFDYFQITTYSLFFDFSMNLTAVLLFWIVLIFIFDRKIFKSLTSRFT